MKTKGMAHQLAALRWANGRAFFGLAMEQGTGKTWTFLADAERAWASGLVDGLLVVAPNGVHLNWTRREIPTHMSGPFIAGEWRTSAGKRERAKLARQLLAPREEGEVPALRILATSYDALCAKDGFAFAQTFVNATRAMIVLDESSRIKNPSALRTARVMRLRSAAVMARIGTGTPITNGPPDIFAQMEFLESGLLGTTSYRAFVAEFAHTMDPKDVVGRAALQNNPRLARMQTIARNPDGTKRWRNLDRLRELLEPHLFRVLKRDCLDLPEKIYQTHYFELAADQRAAYDALAEEYQIAYVDADGNDALLTVSRLAALMKLQQVTSGFVNLPPRLGETTVLALRPPGSNPRMEALLSALEDVDGPVIIWARFREELQQIATLLGESRRVVQYHGGVSEADRHAAVDRFQSGQADTFVGQPQSGGIGITLTAAETVIYYSNDFNLETRLQSEDRAHRIGTRRSVVYIDLAAANTIDEAIARSLQTKQNVAAFVQGDFRNRARGGFEG